ncbi:MAG: hypothetical protein ABI323_10445 [Solirubrobacteraceae bacterium]
MPERNPKPAEESAHDILAAEEFAVGDSDPRLHHEPAHDVLAAEEFAVGALDPVLHHRGPVALPGDPTGIPEPHDVLAAEEFAMPAPRSRDLATALPSSSAALERQGPARLIALGALALLVIRRVRRR